MLLLNSSNTPGQHAAYVEVFSAPESVCHVVLGWSAGRLPPAAAMALSVAYTAYQIAQHPAGESWPRVAGQLLEFSAGLFLAALFCRGE